jgi:hypothetical protein
MRRTTGAALAGGHTKLSVGLLLVVLTTALLTSVAASAAQAGTRQLARPSRPVAKSPAGTITAAKPLFSWRAAARAARYEVRVSRAGSMVLGKAGVTKLSWRSSAALEKNVALTWKVRARNASGAGPWSASRTFKVALAQGDLYGGGRVAYLLRSGDPGYVAGETHGLIAALSDLTPSDPWGVAWSNFTDSLVGAAAQGTALGTGRANTTAIVSQTIDTQHCVGGAAYECANLVAGGCDDWYLPSRDELDKLYLMYVRSLNAAGSDDLGFNPSGHYQAYWSSSELPAGDLGLVLVWYQYFDNDPAPGDDLQNTHFKTQEFSVRAVRSF